MYTTKPQTSPTAQATCPRQATLRPSWWTILEEERLQMHAFTRPSQQLRHKVRAATLRSLHQPSLYMRLILLAKAKGAGTTETCKALQKKLVENPSEGTRILKFAYEKLYNGKLAYRYGHATTDKCPLCHLPDSCTHIAGVCKAHKNLNISRHNAACRLVHTAIRNATKGAGAIYNANDLFLAAADAGSQPQTTTEGEKTLMAP